MAESLRDRIRSIGAETDDGIPSRVATQVGRTGDSEPGLDTPSFGRPNDEQQPDTGAGGNGGSDAGTGERRKPGRPKGSRNRPVGLVESVQLDNEPTLQPVRRANRKSKAIPAEDIALVMSGLFHAVAQARGPHWVKTTDECMVVAEPVESYLAMLPIEKIRKVSGYLLPFSLAIGMVMLLSDPVKRELEIREQKKRNGEQRTPKVAQQTGTRAIRTDGQTQAVPNGGDSRIDSRINDRPADSNAVGDFEFNSIA